MKKSTLFIGLCVLVCTSVNAQFGIINTIAGTGAAGYSGDGGAATSAKLNYTEGIALDASGNVYIADYYNHRIRKVTVSTGIITTVAGTGTAGYNGDGIAATTAELNYPTGVAIDKSGNIYIADWTNQRIRKVTISTGLISTVAGNGTAAYGGDGGPATSAKLNNPDGITLDAAGNIYIGDLSNARVRKVTVSTGIITTIAGNGTPSYTGDGGLATAAGINGPRGVALDAAGNVYFCDWANSAIRVVSVSTGIIETIAGTGISGYSGDGGIATSAKLYQPRGVAVDRFGNVFIADCGNNRIREISSSTGIITTYAGTGTAGYTGDGGPATAAETNGPSDLVLDASTNLFFVDQNNNVAREIGGAVGIQQLTNPVSINVYPNPATNNCNVKFSGNEEGAYNVSVMDITGKEVMQTKKNVVANGLMSMDTSTLPSGIYFVKLSNNNSSEVVKFVKE